MRKLGICLLGVIAAFPLAMALLIVPAPKSPVGMLPVFAQFGGTIPLDTQLCPTVGAIAVRNTTRWQCVPPGTNQQVFVSNGAGAVPGWTTPAGTGNVNATGTPSSGQVPFWTSATTIKGVSPGGTALDAVNGASSTGYEKRTGTGTYSWAAIPNSDLPGYTGTDCSIVAGAGSISCAGLLGNSHVFTAQQGMTYDNPIFPLNNTVSGHSASVQFQYNGTLIAQLQAPSGGGLYQDYSGTLTYRSIDNSYATEATLSNAGVWSPKTIAPVNPVGVAYGGTGATAAGGAALDNILAPGGVGIMFRNGANTYTFNTLSALIDNYASNTQGSILYRSASGWVALPPASSAGQVLASNGAGANPAWVAPGSVTPGTRVLLNTLTASNSANLQDTTSISGSYLEYEVDCEGISPGTNAATFELLVQQGGAFATTGYSDGSQRVANGSVYAATNASYMPVATSLSTLANNYTGMIRISNPGSSTPPRLVGSGSYRTSVPYAETSLYGTLTPQAPITGFELLMSTGNIASGVCKVYGWN